MIYALKVFVSGVELIKQLVSHAVRGALIQILRRDVGGITASHPRDLILDVIGDRGLARCAPHLLAGPHLHREVFAVMSEFSIIRTYAT